ncbi:hypothetical protein A8950_1600 [Dongia mobilis]|uniref:Uncharacterized protein n=1 Tax=Dongia mobilis TaxID=578943 RepID=A0A4R6WQ32_9PROT|nr:hypothetical protein [Dongia mobilis]TDQ83314.1 hypothetical protein A8950_1600 [Dongia mobilis]
MSTGSFENWNGNVLDIGPLYPFVGTEMVWFIICVAFWLAWHVLQWRMEEANYNDDMEVLKKGDNMERALKGEKVLRSM